MSDWITRDFAVSPNADWRETITLGEPKADWTIAGATIVLQVRVFEGRSDTLLDLSTTAGTLVIADGPSRKLSIAVPRATMETLPPWGTYPYDLIVTTGGQSRRRLSGNLIIRPGTTELA